VTGRTIATAGSVLTLALGLAACGSSNKSSGGGGGSTTSSGGGGATVDVYSSLPLQGASSPQTTAMVKGIRLALSQAGNKAGKTTVKYTSLDDSIAQTGAWDPGQTAQNARKVAQDSKAVGYIGEFNSGASAVSIPILNQAGVPQVSPANTYVGLTTSEPGSEKGEPQKYYPTGKRTYLRIVPRDLIQAKALLTLMKQNGCTKIGVANDKDTYGAGLARTIQFAAGQTGQKSQIVSDQGIDKQAPNFRSYASTLKAKGVNCFLFSGITANGAVQLMKDVHAALPSAKLYGPDGICESGFTNPSKKGAPADVTKNFQCTVATLNLSAYPGGQNFLKAYKAKYGDAHPDPYAIYGFEGMKLFIDTIKKLGDKGSDKSAVLDALFATKNRSSVLGTYSFDQNGDTSLTDYGVYKVGGDGNPTFFKAIKSASS